LTAFTVFLIDDDRAILKALSRLLEASGYQTKAYSSPDAFLREDDNSVPGCVLLDLAMPRLNGLDVQEKLALNGINRPVIFLTGHATIAQSVLAMRAGAMDFLTKPVDKALLLNAIKSAQARDKAQRHEEARRNAVLRKLAKLTPRQREVLHYIVRGRLNKETAFALGVGEKTVKAHRGRILEKMGVRKMAELVRMTIGISQMETKRDDLPTGDELSSFHDQ